VLAKDCPGPARSAVGHLHKIQGLTIFEMSICWFCVRIDEKKSVFHLSVNVNYMHFQNIWECNTLGDNICLCFYCTVQKWGIFFCAVFVISMQIQISVRN